MNIKIIGNESSNRIKLLKNLNKAIDNIRLNIKFWRKSFWAFSLFFGIESRWFIWL